MKKKTQLNSQPVLGVFGSVKSYLTYKWKRLLGKLPLEVDSEVAFQFYEKIEKEKQEQEVLKTVIAQLTKDNETMRKSFEMERSQGISENNRLVLENDLMKKEIDHQSHIIVLYESALEKYTTINKIGSVPMQ